MPYYNNEPKRDPNCDNHPHVLLLVLGPSTRRSSGLLHEALEARMLATHVVLDHMVVLSSERFSIGVIKTKL